MNLRPHHLLCIQKFSGHGYDEAFTEHMTSVLAILTENKNTSVTVTEGCDILCVRCPHNTDGACASLEKVALMDKSTLELCGLSYGDTVPWVELASKARGRIFETDDFCTVCSSCQWFELCRSTGGYNG